MDAIFLEAQDFNATENIVYQDNQNSTRLEKHGQASSGKKTCHMNILGCVFQRNFGGIPYILVLLCHTQRKFFSLCHNKTEKECKVTPK